jgi:hypothetical protein
LPHEETVADRPILRGVLCMHIASEEYRGRGRGPALAGVHRGLLLRLMVPHNDVGDRNVELAP